MTDTTLLEDYVRSLVRRVGNENRPQGGARAEEADDGPAAPLQAEQVVVNAPGSCNVNLVVHYHPPPREFLKACMRRWFARTEG